MYAAVLFIGIQNGQTVQPIVDVERTVFYREKAAGMYSALPYAFAQVITTQGPSKLTLIEVYCLLKGSSLLMLNEV